MIASGDTNRTGGLFTKSAERCELSFDVIKPWPHALEQPFTGLGWRNAAGGSGEKPKAKPRFDPAGRLTERRLGYAGLSGRAGKASFACNSTDMPAYGSESGYFGGWPVSRKEGQLPTSIVIE